MPRGGVTVASHSTLESRTLNRPRKYAVIDWNVPWSLYFKRSWKSEPSAGRPSLGSAFYKMMFKVTATSTQLRSARSSGVMFGGKVARLAANNSAIILVILGSVHCHNPTTAARLQRVRLGGLTCEV